MNYPHPELVLFLIILLHEDLPDIFDEILERIEETEASSVDVQ